MRRLIDSKRVISHMPYGRLEAAQVKGLDCVTVKMSFAVENTKEVLSQGNETIFYLFSNHSYMHYYSRGSSLRRPGDSVYTKDTY